MGYQHWSEGNWLRHMAGHSDVRAGQGKAPEPDGVDSKEDGPAHQAVRVSCTEEKEFTGTIGFGSNLTLSIFRWSRICNGDDAATRAVWSHGQEPSVDE